MPSVIVIGRMDDDLIARVRVALGGGPAVIGGRYTHILISLAGSLYPMPRYGADQLSRSSLDIEATFRSFTPDYVLTATREVHQRLGPGDEDIAWAGYWGSQTNLGPIQGREIAQGIAEQAAAQRRQTWHDCVTELVTSANGTDWISIVDWQG